MHRSLIHRSALYTLAAALLMTGLAAGGCKQPTDGQGPEPESVQPAGGAEPYYPGLIEEYRKNLAQDPHNLAANIALANALYDSGHWREAVRYYEDALKLDPHNADVITDMGTCFRNLGSVDKALSAYERALTFDETHQNALFNIGVVYGFDKKDYPRAIAAWDRLLHVAPNYPKAAYVRETMHSFRKRAAKGDGR